MTYRLVPPEQWAKLQKATLVVTAIIGVSIALAPPDRDSRLTAIESAMNVDVWAYSMMLAAVLALGLEIYMTHTKDERPINLVGYCHIAMCSLMAGYTSSAAAGVLTRTWWNFGSVAVGLLLVYLHLIFIRRRPHAQV